MPFPPNSTERYQKRKAEEFKELKSFRDRMETIRRIDRENYAKLVAPKRYPVSEPTQGSPDYPWTPPTRRGGGFGRLVGYVVFVIIALAVYQQIRDPHPQGPAQTAPTEPAGLALASQTVSWLSPEMLICEGSSYGCSEGNKFIATHRYQVLKCIFGDTYYLFWKDSAPPGWDRFVYGHAFNYFGKSVLAQCPTSSTEAARVF